MNTYVYQIDNNLYINLTNKCTNQCVFCVRNEKASYFGHKLWLEKEPDADDVIALIPDVKKYNEIVFCGFGEPTIKLAELKKIAEYVKENGGTTRLNTNGHGNLIHKKDISAELLGKIDKINVSLNECNENDYNELCKPCFKNAFSGLQEFAVSCKKRGINVWFSVVDCIGEQKIAECKKIAENCGVTLRVREFIKDSE